MYALTQTQRAPKKSMKTHTQKMLSPHAFRVRLTNDRKYNGVMLSHRIAHIRNITKSPGQPREDCHSNQGLLLWVWNCHALKPPDPMSCQSIIRFPIEKWIYSNKLRFSTVISVLSAQSFSLSISISFAHRVHFSLFVVSCMCAHMLFWRWWGCSSLFIVSSCSDAFFFHSCHIILR